MIVLDSVGIGEAPDAAGYGDVGADTLGNIAARVGGLRLPNLAQLGLGNISRPTPLIGCPPAAAPRASFGKLQETAHGKDTATGHWEFMGLVLDDPLTTYPDGFPAELIAELTRRWGVSGVLGNVAASGTQIIEALGPAHIQTGRPIVYTSADPVLQIAAHEDVVPIETLYQWCEAAFDLAIAHGLSRVIARPFVGLAPDFQRTARRRDFTLPPPRPTILNELEDAGISCVGIGKISSIFSGSGIAREVITVDNNDGVDATLRELRSGDSDFIFTNLVDFDSRYGHRRDAEGYHRCLQEFDARLPELLLALGPEDLLIITADHGNDPTYRGSDHTREYVPVLLVGAGARPGRDLGVRESFADVGQTVADFFGVQAKNPLGRSMLSRRVVERVLNA